MRIQHNIMAMNAYRNYTTNTSALSKNLEKLSSGYKINRAGDDAAGLAISEKMRAQITGLETAQKNAKDGISLVQTAEGALTEVHDMLNRMVELADQSANGTYDDTTDRANLQKEFDQLKSEIDRIADSSNFNGIKLLDGSLKAGTELDTYSAELVSAAAGSKVGVDLTVQGNGDFKKITFAVASNAAKASIASTGVTVTLQKGHTYTAADIQEVITAAAAAVKSSTGAASAVKAVAGALEEATVSGSDIVVGANGAAPATASVAAAVDKGKDLTLQIGDTSDDYNQLNVSIQDMHVEELGLTDIKISDQTSAQDAVKAIKTAINTVSSVRGDLGATQNRLDHTINNLSVMQENIQDAESTIRDTDVADEMMAYTKNNILVQSAQAMLAQANQIPQGVLQLLQ